MDRWPEHRRDRFAAGPWTVFVDDFDGDLDRAKWSPVYLPHWSAQTPAEARFCIDDGRLVLRVDPDQPPWCPEFDGDVRVSALQTGHRSGPVGSGDGQHRFRSGLVVRRDWPEARFCTPRHGSIAVRARASLSAVDLVSLYLIGFEDAPADSGEITVFEIFGRNVGPGGVVVGRGVKAINDPRLISDFIETELPIDVGDWHEYAADWSATGVRFFVDGNPVGETRQAPDYPMQLMLTCYRLRAGTEPGPSLEVDYVRVGAPAG